MHPGRPDKLMLFQPLKYVLFFVLALSSCTIVKKQYKKSPFIVKNKIEVIGGKFSKDELIALNSRLNTQLEDSAKINVVDKLFFWHIFNKPAAFDTGYLSQSAKNMQASMLHLGYYRATASYRFDTIERKNYPIISLRKFPLYTQNQQRIHVTYKVAINKPVLIDTVSYHLLLPELEKLAFENMDESLLQKDNPVTKAAVLGEINRLLEIYRNNGYYKITAEELKVRGDTSLAALTTISDDPFEQLELLALAQQKKDSPKIKLAVILNPPADSNRLKKYYINNIYILPDYRPGDKYNDPSLTERVTQQANYTIRYHHKIIKTNFLIRNMFIKKGDLYNQTNYYKTLNSFSKAGVWQSAAIEIIEPKDSSGKIDLVIQLIPAKQFAFEASVEASYSANSNTNSVTTVNAGNLLGLSGNLSFTNRNLGKEGIKWTNAIRSGVELNLKPDRNNRKNIINSNEVGFTSTAIIPRFILLPKKWNNLNYIVSPQTFTNLNLSYINRINLFNLQTSNLGYGYTFHNRKNGEWTYKPINIEFAKLYNESDLFLKTLDSFPFLRYSFNTALVAGASLSYSIAGTNLKHNKRQWNFKANLEESGFPLIGFVPVPMRKLNLFNQYLKQFFKADFEFTNSRSRLKSAFVSRFFLGAGVASKRDTTLPFFKQYFGGGSNSMRGWPVRGIGRGSQPLAPYGTSRFNDRTGDIQFEANFEYRYNIAQIIPNTMLLKGALFIDAGNIWNLRNSKQNGGVDSAQFQIKNFWRDMGINAGTGFRIDFNYFVIRLDLGFRFKRPELAYTNNGWKIPALSFNDVFQKVFSKGIDGEFRKWRYNNFNFTIGINYPF
jgi:outer membrane protein assembly factor BamA